jgi:hypothetical protein
MLGSQVRGRAFFGGARLDEVSEGVHSSHVARLGPSSPDLSHSLSERMLPRNPDRAMSRDRPFQRGKETARGPGLLESASHDEHRVTACANRGAERKNRQREREDTDAAFLASPATATATSLREVEEQPMRIRDHTPLRFSGEGFWFLVSSFVARQEGATVRDRASTVHFTRSTLGFRRTKGLQMADQIVRCPYCVLDDDFRPMLPRPEGWFLCGKCGHTTIPENPEFRCSCKKCSELNQAA